MKYLEDLINFYENNRKHPKAKNIDCQILCRLTRLYHQGVDVENLCLRYMNLIKYYPNSTVYRLKVLKEKQF